MRFFLENTTVKTEKLRKKTINLKMKKKMEVQDYKSKTLWKLKIVKIQDFATKKK